MIFLFYFCARQIDESSMKSKEQILRYVSQNSFPDKDDWRKVLVWCKKNYGGGKAHKALKPIGSSTFEQFMSWIDDGPAVGDIVKSGETIGILGGYSKDKAFLSNAAFEGRLITKKTWISPESIKNPSEEELQSVKNMIKSQKSRYSVALSRLVAAYLPNDGDFVRILQEKKTILGIYRGEIGDEYSFYGVVSRNKFTGERNFPNNVTLDAASKTDARKIGDALAASGLQWLPESKKIVEISETRVKRGEYFWYMSERLMPESDMDTYGPRCNERFLSGNYFRSFSKCYEFCMAVKELRKKL